ncbi:hypothetical protein HG535_0C04320 [Zygotorulaspora mrakii]|uniref:SGNH hydrolase-type esterase domain-containing protein n=1 Tax=Zygotorulaspora mrakii TaxID=42260 RepID=A0A7H9B0C2_ZYGMR|nr:uncharacterized protein HG535_0C04320 [Zygotorulaspora mrakii]QLG72078.1 hypothetical protein HG535_0C04320 [Zygotorulaspora mrakii]
MGSGKFLLFGDSITEYAFKTDMLEDDHKHYFALGAALCDIYTRKLDIVQRGYGGYNTRWALNILPRILESEPNIRMSTIFFGSNDAVSRGPQHISLPEYESNIRKLIALMKAKDIKPIVVGPALPDEVNWGKHSPASVENNYIRNTEGFKAYSDTAAMVALEENVPFVNLNEAFVKQGGANWRGLLRDGLHFSGEGYEIFFNELMKVIENSYPYYHPSNIPMQYPPWREVVTNPELLERNYF